jgi:neopullulanase
MKNLLLSIIFIAITFSAKSVTVDRMEPAFWWVGMKNPELQIMVYGKNIAKSKVKINYPGVKINDVVSLDNRNYLFIYLNISPRTKPGVINIEFTDSTRNKFVQPYSLKARENAGGCAGFNSADVLYLIMPDRFANGDLSNDSLDGVLADRTKPNARHGGDFKGITDHLDYIKDLGATTIWLNPVQENKSRYGSYHGYAITDFYKVDPRFGSNEDYSLLIEKIHSKGMKLVMDMIFNHCGSSHWWMNDIPSKDWINSTDTYTQTTHYIWTVMDVHASESDKKSFQDGWFSRGMPDLNQRNPHLAKYLIQNCIWWIEYSRIDGIRQDTYSYADYDFMAKWCKEIFDEYPQFNIVGETWYNRGAGPAWWQANSELNNKNSNLKTVMDFSLTFIMQKAFEPDLKPVLGELRGVSALYEEISQDFIFPDPNNLLIFAENHDLPRFFKNDETDLKRYKQALAFLLTTRGIPQIYYGMELLMTDPNRKDFPGGWPNDSINSFSPSGRTPIQNEAWDYLQKLLQWRQTNVAVSQGKLIHFAPDGESNVYVYARIKDDKTILVLINGSSVEKTIQMKRFSEVISNFAYGKDIITGNKMDIRNSLTIPASGEYILELEN